MAYKKFYSIKYYSLQLSRNRKSSKKPYKRFFFFISWSNKIKSIIFSGEREIFLYKFLKEKSDSFCLCIERANFDHKAKCYFNKLNEYLSHLITQDKGAGCSQREGHHQNPHSNVLKNSWISTWL